MSHNTLTKIFLSIVFISVSASPLFSQKVNTEDSLMLRKIFDTALLEGKSYDWLEYLSNDIGGRLSGSLEAERAVEYTKKEF